MRRSYQRSSPRPEGGTTESADAPTGEGSTTLAALVAELAETKRQDLAAKRAGHFEDRAALGRMIYDLMRQIAAARGASLG